MEFSQYSNEVKYGATIGSASLQASGVLGSKTSLTKFYTVIGVGTTGATAVNLFGSATAPVAGTITGFYCVAGTVSGTSAGTYTLFGTTAGTIATIPVTAANFSNGTISVVAGTTIGTGVLNAAVAQGDTVTVTGTGVGTSTAYVTFITAS